MVKQHTRKMLVPRRRFMGESHELETLIKKDVEQLFKKYNGTMKKEILKTVMERIREKVPELRWVDADEGQLDFQDSRPPVAFPCCLVELSYPGAENMSAAHPGMQRVQVSLELKIGFNDCASFNVNKPLQVQETAFARLDMVEALHRAVQGFKNGELRQIIQKSAVQTAEETGRAQSL